MPRQESHFLLRGGVDLVSSQLAPQPGRMWRALNYEPVENGYRRIRGYERFDGRPSPSEARYWILPYTLGAGQPGAPVEATIIGAASGATAVVLALRPALSAEDTPAFVLGDLDGAFVDGEALTASGFAIASAAGPVVASTADSIAEDLSFRAAAAERRRANITAVPGTGAVLGIHAFDNDIYAIRNNAGRTAAVMHRATASGWQAIDLGYRMKFDGGSNAPSPPSRIAGVASGARATVAYVDLRSGAWADGDAAGTLWLRTIDGTFQDGETIQNLAASTGPTTTSTTSTTPAPSSVLGTVDGTATANELAAHGRWEFINENFSAMPGAECMFGVNGQGRAFCWTGRYFRFIETGLSDDDDKPTHLTAQSNHLVLGYPSGSLQISATGDPVDWTAARGAAEIACGQKVLGLVSGVGQGNTLIVGEDRIQVLYGSDATDFNLTDLSARETGGVEWTVQQVGMPLYVDNRGVRAVATADTYGNFQIGSMTTDIQPWIDAQNAEGNTPISSMRLRASDQYRVFFDSGLCVIVYVGRGQPELGFIDYGVAVRCTVTTEDEDRVERVLFGSDDGWVFEAEKGQSFDQRTIPAYVRLPLGNAGDPTHMKRWISADIYADLGSEIQMNISAIFDDGNSPETLGSIDAIRGGGGLWDEVAWDEFYWDSPLNGFNSYPITGFGSNCSILLRSESAIEPEHTLTGITMHWSRRRLKR